MTCLYRRSRPAAGLAFGVFLAAAFPLAAQNPASQPAEETFGGAIDVSVVNLDVFVTDKKGQPVTGLRKEDFEVHEDGKPVEISNFFAESRGTAAPAPAGAAAPASTPAKAAAERPVAQRLRLVVFVDDVNLTAANRSRILQSVQRFLHGELKPGDEVMIVRYDQKLDIRRQFTDDLSVLDADLQAILKLPTDVRKYEQALNTALRGIRFSTNGGEGIGALAEGAIASWAGEESVMVQGALDGLDSVVSWLAGLPGRKAILYVSDGLPLVPGLDLYTIYSRAAQGIRYAHAQVGGGNVVTGVGMTDLVCHGTSRQTYFLRNRRQGRTLRDSRRTGRRTRRREARQRCIRIIGLADPSRL